MGEFCRSATTCLEHGLKILALKMFLSEINPLKINSQKACTKIPFSSFHLQRVAQQVKLSSSTGYMKNSLLVLQSHCSKFHGYQQFEETLRQQG